MGRTPNKRGDWRKRLDGLELTRVGSEEPAGLWIASVPVPRGGPTSAGLGKRATHVKPLGRWYGEGEGGPRRVLLMGDAGGAAPENIHVSLTPAKSKSAPPTAEAELLANARQHDFYWERHLLRLDWKGRSVGFAMGMRVKGVVHWWEYCKLVTLAESPACREVEMAGGIPYVVTDADTHAKFAGKDNPFIHKHNWINGHIYARLHSNGVCEIFAHHINTLFVDLGVDFQDAVPVLGIRVEGGEPAVSELLGPWDGTRQGIEAGGVQFDMTEAAYLATAKQPGRMDWVDGFLAWQPYEGVELYSGREAELRTGDPYVFHAKDKIMPRGMARTLRFTLSLSDDRPARVARYLAPAWWYGLCEEFMPEPLLPVSTDYDAAIDSARQWVHTFMVKGGFEDGQYPNGMGADPTKRQTPATEGDFAGAMFLTAYRTHDWLDYDCAMRGSYNFTDTLVDHATHHVRMQDYTPPAMALPLQRVHACLAAWLETGDQYCVESGRAVIYNAYRWHKNAWPRMAIGRDASFIHGAMLLYKFLGDPRALEIARDTLHDLAEAQWPDGTFGDQGAGAGIHARSAFIIKPWMGWLATVGALDYLEQFPDDAEVLGIVEKFIDWKMKHRGPKAQGEKMGWTYQYPFHAREQPGLEPQPMPGPELHLFHFDYLARLLTFWSLRTGDPKYFDAFAQSYEGMGPVRNRGYWDCTAALYYLPWLSAKLWNARPEPRGGISVEPVHLGPRTPKKATVMAPDGPVEVSWSESGKVVVPRSVKMRKSAKKSVRAKVSKRKRVRS